MVKENINAEDESKLKNYIFKLRSLIEKKEKPDKHDLNSILDDLNLINCAAISSDEKCTCVQLCCSLIVPSDTMLIGKCSQVITRFIQDGKISEEMIVIITNWCLNALTKSSDIIQTEILSVLELLFKTNINNNKQLIDNVLQVLKDPLEKKSKLINPNEILFQRLNCIIALIPSMNANHMHIVKNIVLQYIQSDFAFKDNVKSQILLAQLEILQKLGEKSISWLSDNIGIVLGISLAFASYGLPHYVQSIPQYLLPTPLLYPEGKTSISKINSKTKHRRKQKKNIEKINSAPLDDFQIPEINWSQTSESDFSDSEISRNARLNKSERKIRLAAFSLLLNVVRTVGKKELAGYWNNMLSGPYSVLKTLSADTSPRSRVAITTILSILFSTGKLYLSQAQQSSKTNNLSYTSWFHLLADLIVTSHEVLCSLVMQSQSVISTLSLLQCLTILVRNTPYHRMNDGILKNVLPSVNAHLKHPDCNVRVAAIKCLIEVIVFEPNTEEQILLIRSNDLQQQLSTRTDSWIVSYFLASVQNEQLAVAVRAECWSLLGCLAKHHFVNITCDQRLNEIITVLHHDLQDSNVVIQQKAAKAFEQIAIPMGSLGSSCGVNCYEVWLSMLQGPLVPMLQSTSEILASAAADCIATITPTVFEQLPERLRIFIMTVLCGCVGHEEHPARSAAVRTLGTIVMFPFLSQDIQIIYDVADRIVSAMKDENLSVRSKAAWALGNLSDVLLAGRKTGIPIEEVSLLNVLEKAVHTGNDHEKVKACSMRAVGNLMMLVEEEHLQTNEFRRLTTEAASTLMYNASNENNMKVRWNACYSLGNMLKNTLLVAHVRTGWQVQVFETLSRLIVMCSNFKVRQAASSALSVIADRQLYGDYYRHLWPSLMAAFENSQNLPEFSEYKHQRNLVDQLCMTFCHLCTLVNGEDLHELDTILSPQHVESCQKYIKELKRRNAEVRTKFNEAVRHIESIIGHVAMAAEQRQMAHVLMEILNASEPIENDDDGKESARL